MLRNQVASNLRYFRRSLIRKGVSIRQFNTMLRQEAWHSAIEIRLILLGE